MLPRALLPLILGLLFQLWGGAALSVSHQGWLHRCNSTDCTPHQALQQQQRGHPWALPRFAATADAGVVRAGAHVRTLLGGKQHAQSHRRQLQQATSTALPDASNPAMAQWLQDSASNSRRFAKGSCFEDYPGFIAKDITDFVRLIQDPAATHIELKGDIVFTHDYFPPGNAHDQSKGYNISHKVKIRACTSPQEPVIVDVNNLLQQVYVYGVMEWQGSIKFINSFPSPRRGGLYALISVLSVEGDGIVRFKGLQIHGYEPSPLFKPDDPYWSVYQNSTAFTPQPEQYMVIDSQALVMHNWTFNKTAWVIKSQGSRGVVAAEGDGYWRWEEVLITWSAPAAAGAGRLQGTALALAVALPLVFGVLLLAGGAVLVWWCCRRQRRGQQQVVVTDEFSEKTGPYMTPSGPSTTSHSGGRGGLGPSTWGGMSGTEMTRTGTYNSSCTGTAQLIEQARRRMQEMPSVHQSSIMLESLLGEGTFGKVYSGVWKGTSVAVKTMVLPAAMSGKERREKMAIMETAISSSLSHPNIVQTYTYEVKPLTGELARKAIERKTNPADVTNTESAFTFLDDTDSTSDHHGWELRLVLEMADRGNLKDHLRQGGFVLPDGQRDMAGIVATALDIARAMLHLHTESIIHSDLKARNVLLKSAGNDTRGFVAKVSDFGLSMRIDPSETHVSNFYQGTLTHMAPETLMYGKLSFSSDVYAYGIILWEMYTAQQAFKGVPRALLGHEVTKMGSRPEFPPECPFDYQLLACRCWESDPAIRPTFSQILDDLERMSSKLQSKRMIDSASSLPMQPSAPGWPGNSTTQGHAMPPAGYPSQSGPAAAAAAAGGVGLGAAAAAAAAGGVAALLPVLNPSPEAPIDPNKYHNWEPQTSLLELRSSTLQGTESGAEGRDVATDPRQQQQQQQALSQQQTQWRARHGLAPDAAHAQQQQQQQGYANGGAAGGSNASLAAPCSMAASSAAATSQQLGLASLGTWDAPSGGFLMASSGGSSAVEGIFGCKGPLGQAPWEQAVGAAAAGGGEPALGQEAPLAGRQMAGVMLHHQHYQQMEMQQQQQQQQQALQHGLGPGLQQQQQEVSLQEYMLLQQQQQLCGQPRQHSQQQQRQAEPLPCIIGGANAAASASSSGVYVDNSSSLGLDGSTVRSDFSGTGSTGGNPDSGDPNGAGRVPPKSPQVQQSSVIL